jgi:hypothetical protein
MEISVRRTPNYDCDVPNDQCDIPNGDWDMEKPLQLAETTCHCGKQRLAAHQDRKQGQKATGG